MSKRVVLFSNPLAGRGKALRISEAVCREIKSAAIERFQLPSAAGDLQRLRQLHDIDVAIVVGGDGTLQGVAEMLLEAFRKPPPVLLVPLGTANLIAKHLRVPWKGVDDVSLISRAISNRKIVELDVCRCNQRVFLAMAGVGFDAHVVHELHRRRRGPITMLSYVLPAIETVRGYKFPQLEVRVDGKKVFALAPGLAYIANIREYGTGVKMLPGARSDDGLLDVCVLPCRDPLQAVQWLMRAATDMHLRSEGVVYTRGRRIRVISPEPVAIQLDGEAAGHTPAEIELMPERLEFIVA